MKINYFLPEFYAYEHNERHDELKSDLLPKIEENPLKDFWGLSHCKTTYGSDDNDFLIHPILDEMVWSCVDQLLCSSLMRNCEDKIKLKSSTYNSIWCNKYKSGDYQEIHNHTGVPSFYRGQMYYNTFSFIYLLHSESETGTVFRSRNISFDTSTNPHSSAYKYAKEGTLIMFPYFMDHFVLPASGDRVTITGNIMSIME